MKKIITTVITTIAILALTTLGFIFSDYSLSNTQIDTLIILLIICGASALYCFVVGEISGNNSQMDKLWSLLPIAYTWIIAIKGDMKPRLVLFALIVTLWGIRLTFNFARKGAYKLKFWLGKEDYRWSILRKNSILKNRFLWLLFDLFFICIYQNALVLAISIPSFAAMESTASLGIFDYLGAFLALFFLLFEAVADEQQWQFYKQRGRFLLENKNLDEIPSPYNKGFNTLGFWSVMRHPNYLGEQGVWISLYLLAIGSGITTYGIFNYSITGPLFLILLFMGSSSFGESISNSKYAEYKYFQHYVFKYLPIRKYDEDGAKRHFERKK